MYQHLQNRIRRQSTATSEGTFPNGSHTPTGRDESIYRLSITLLIASNFSLPKCGVGSGLNSKSAIMSMPKAAVDEDYSPSRRKD